MRQIEAPWRDWEATDPDGSPENGDGANGSGDDATVEAASSEEPEPGRPAVNVDAPLWSTADNQVLHLAPAAVERIILGGGGAPSPRRRTGRRVPRARRRRVIRAIGQLARRARRVPGPRPVFRARAQGRTFRIRTRPRHGWRNEIISIEPETTGRPLTEPEVAELWTREEETGELEVTVPPPAQFDAKAFAATLGEEWSRRRGGTPSVEAMTTWLLKDLADTLAGARLRWKKGQFTEASIARGWAISRLENMRFQLAPAAGIRPLVNFAPPPPPIALIPSPLVENSTVAPVAPLVVKFVQELKKRYPKPFRATNYRGHGGGAFNGRGFSLDLYLTGKDSRGFFPTAEAIAYMRAVHQAAVAVGAEWRVLYNDFAVADVINRETRARHMAFMGVARYKDKAKTKVSGLNWHGPHPLILHFHLDLAPSRGGASR